MGARLRIPEHVPGGPATSPAWPVALWLLGLLTAFHPTLFSGFGLIQTDPGDTRLNNYVLEHGLRWLLRDPAHARFWDPPMFFPATNTAAYADVLAGAAPMYWAWRAAGVAPDTAHQLWMMTVLSLDFWAAWLWLGRGLRPAVVPGSLPAAAGAFVFAFGAPRVAQLGHQQLLAQFYTILALLCVTRIVLRPGREARPWIAGLCASVALQLWTGYYLGWFLLLGLGIAAIWALVLREPRRRMLELLRAHAPFLLACGLAAAALLAPMASHYLAAARTAGWFPFESEMLPGLPRIQSWVYVGGGSWLYSWQEGLPAFRGLPRAHEHRAGVGLITTGVAVAGLLAERRRDWVRVLGLASVSLILLVTLFPGGAGVWRPVHDALPGAGAVRSVVRVTLLLLVPASAGVALLLARMRSAAAAALVALVCAAEQARTTPSFDKERSREEVRALASRIGPECAAFYYSAVLPPGATGADWDFQEWKLQVDAMWAGMLRGVPTVNGYSGRFPPGWGPLFDNRIRFPSDETRIRSALTAWTRKGGLDPARLCRIRAPVAAPDRSAVSALHVPDHAHGLHRHEHAAVPDQLLERRQHGLDPFARVDGLDEDGKVAGHLEELLGADDRGRAEDAEEDPEDEAPRHVHGQRPPGEGRTGAGLDSGGQQEPQDSPDSRADEDEEQTGRRHVPRAPCGLSRWSCSRVFSRTAAFAFSRASAAVSASTRTLTSRDAWRDGRMGIPARRV